MTEYLKEEQEVLAKMEKAGFTEEQIDAIYSWIEFAKGSLGDYIRDIEIEDTKTLLKQDIRTHRHLETGEVTRPY